MSQVHPDLVAHGRRQLFWPESRPRLMGGNETVNRDWQLRLFITIIQVQLTTIPLQISRRK